MKHILIILFLTIVSVAVSQKKHDTKVLNAEASKKMTVGNYKDAINDYLKLLSGEPKNTEYNFNIGVCYLKTNVNKAKAANYFEVAMRDEKHNPNTDFLLGIAYQYANRFDDAIDAFKKFLSNGKGNPDNLKAAVHEIQYCINAKEIIKFPVNATFEALNQNSINSPYADFYPFITDDEAFIIFNSNRPIGKDPQKEGNGSYPNSILISQVEDGKFQRPEVLNEVILEGSSDEQVIGMNTKGTILLIYSRDVNGKGEIYISEKNTTGKFAKPQLLPYPINSNGDEIAASVNEDGSVIYFASERKGGLGGTDIYVCRKLSNNKWADAENLGPSINTPYDEDFPNISPDGKTLYFSSLGHSSMGGFDIFKAQYDETSGKFINPKNLGYPINTPFDDMNFRVSKTGRYGYLASLRNGGTNDLDIYRVTFNDVEVDYTVVVADIKTADASQLDPRTIFITVNNDDNGELVGNYVPNPNNGRSVMILNPGNYSINVEATGYKNYVFTINILDKVSYQSEKEIVIELVK